MISMLPLAAADSWIGFVVFLVIMIISAISQMAGNKKEAPRPPAPRPRPRPPVRPAQAGPGQQGPVARELEEFLRRAGGQPQGRPPQQPGFPQPGPAPRPPVARPMPARPVVAQPVAAEIVDDLEVIESMADHVGHSVGGLQAQLDHRAGQPGGFAHSFNRQMGQFDSSGAQAEREAAFAEPDPHGEFLESLPPTAAAGLAAILAAPTSLRQAILLSEIIQRPVHRWS
jgi:hypothetical protein